MTTAQQYWGVIVDALAAKANGKPPVGTDKIEEAAVCLVAARLVSAGMSVEKAVGLFEKGDFTIKLRYEYDTDEIGLTIEWDDGQKMDLDKEAG